MRTVVLFLCVCLFLPITFSWLFVYSWRKKNVSRCVKHRKRPEHDHFVICVLLLLLQNQQICLKCGNMYCEGDTNTEIDRLRYTLQRLVTFTSPDFVGIPLPCSVLFSLIFIYMFFNPFSLFCLRCSFISIHCFLFYFNFCRWILISNFICSLCISISF